MPRKSPFKHHRFARDIILCAVRWYLCYPFSSQDGVDLLDARGVMVDRSTMYRWVQKFGPELTKRTGKYLRRASVDWHVTETYTRVGGKCRWQVAPPVAGGRCEWPDGRFLPDRAAGRESCPDFLDMRARTPRSG